MIGIGRERARIPAARFVEAAELVICVTDHIRNIGMVVIAERLHRCYAGLVIAGEDQRLRRLESGRPLLCRRGLRRGGDRWGYNGGPRLFFLGLRFRLWLRLRLRLRFAPLALPGLALLAVAALVTTKAPNAAHRFKALLLAGEPA